MAPLIEQRPRAIRQLTRQRGGYLGHVGQLLTHRLIGGRHRLALIDGGCPREGAIHTQMPLIAKRNGQLGLQLHAIGVNALDIAGREESLGCGQPYNPILHVRVKPRGRAREGVTTLASYGKREARIVGPAALTL